MNEILAVKISVEKIYIENFKKIEKQEIAVKPITAIVGGNASGKSSILQAAQLCTSICQASFKNINRNNKIEFHKTLANEDVFYRPTQTILDLRFEEPASQTKSIKLGFQCIIHDNTTKAPKPIDLKVAITRGKNANLALKYEGNESLISNLGDRNHPFSIFTPGLSGIPIREEWRTRGALDAAAMHGDANLYLRTLLDHLFTKDLDDRTISEWVNWQIDIDELPETSSWRAFSTYLNECYEGARVYVKHDRSKERYINVEVWYLEKSFTLDMASTGMLQVIQILAYACFYEPPLLLLDEPDAHLHADSQAKLHSALKILSSNSLTKIVLATHSPQFLQLLQNDPDASIVWLSSGKEVVVQAGQQPAIPLLMELGALTLGADVFQQKYKTILLTEDKDTDLIKPFVAAQTNKAVSIISYNGCANLPGARQLAILLSRLRPDAKIVIHRDRDFRTAEEMDFERLLFEAWLEYEGGTNIQEIFTPGNDIEHSFLDTNHLQQSLNGYADAAKIENALINALAIKRDDLTAKTRSARAVIKERLYDTIRIQGKTALRTKAKLKPKPPADSKFLPRDGKTPLSLDQCHGKLAYKSFLTSLHQLIGGDSKAIPDYIIKSTHHLECPIWKNALA
ncbi:ATP-binding protein [Pseudomonas xanthosomatis]|uniref:AAA family ATPase n=1 Tax=Pseudomonas xanthosomatis TaxID=2842356 RepID=UPI001C3CFDAD|nr:ATP-binding protein [Pseudomonas xanthosomatis]QXH44950.1 ATP-binding protein [Pseudomonas xanthosomatis]